MSAQRLQLTVLHALGLAGKAALSPLFYQFPPSAVAAACLAKGREALGLAPTWPVVLHQMTGYSPTAPGDATRQCAELLTALGLAA